MTLTPQASKQIIVIGITELVLALIAIICGAVAMGKLSGLAHATIGIWAIYFIIPGFLCLATGYYKTGSLAGLALAANIVGIILAIIALSLGAILWTFLASCTTTSFLGTCFCSNVWGTYGTTWITLSCSDMQTLKNSMGAATVMQAFLMVVSFIGSIFGCASTCCAPREPAVIVTGTAPGQTVVVSSTQNIGFSPPPYNVQQGYAMQGYPGGVPQQQPYPGGVPQQQPYPGGVHQQPPYPGVVPAQGESKTPL